jgi:hypothetical protein
MVSFEAPWGQIPSMAQLPSSMAMKVIISEVMTSLALMVALRMPGTRPHTAPATIEAMTRIATDSQAGALRKIERDPDGAEGAEPHLALAANVPELRAERDCRGQAGGDQRLAVISVWPMG